MWEQVGMDIQTSPLPLEGLDAFQMVRALRREREETVEQFGQVVGLSKGKVSELENGTFRPGVDVALRIEALSGNRIDAAELSEDVRKARHGLPAAEGEG